MRIYITSVFVDDQEKALAFYRDVLGFAPKHDIPMGEDRWLTVTFSEAPEGPQLLLEPSGHPAVPPFKQALVRDGIPAASFAVDDVQAEYERLQERGVLFTQAPVTMGEVTMAVFDDTCGNLVQIVAGG